LNCNIVFSKDEIFYHIIGVSIHVNQW